MSDEDDKYKATLVNRLASTTNRLRNLFYINLILASAVLYLVYQDPGFVSERANLALQRLVPIFMIDRRIKETKDDFEDYRNQLVKTLSDFRNLSFTLRLMEKDVDEVPNELRWIEEEFEKLQEREVATILKDIEEKLSKEQNGLLDLLREVDDEAFPALIKLTDDYFETDLRGVQLEHVEGFVFFLLSDYWFPIVADAYVSLSEANKHLPDTLSRLDNESRSDLRHLTPIRYAKEVLSDTVLEGLLFNIPNLDTIFESLLIVRAFCVANELAHCSRKEIEDWQTKQGSRSPGKLTAPGVEVAVTRRLLVLWSPLIILFAQHLYMMQFRRREVLRKELGGGNRARSLSLLDEAWILDSLVLNTGHGTSIWHRVQSSIMALFLFVGQSAPFLAVVAASYSLYVELAFSREFLHEFSTLKAEFEEFTQSIGNYWFPEMPEPPGLFWEYPLLALAIACGLLLLGSLVQLLKEQWAEVLRSNQCSEGDLSH